MKLFHKFLEKTKWVRPQKTEQYEEVCEKQTEETPANANTDDKPTAIAFVDFENWFYSYKNIYKIKPDIIGWRDELEREYKLKDILVFADFSQGGIDEKLADIRCATNTIIETRKTTDDSAKDMTDFIILDYIYQYAYKYPEIETFILFTGDSHFLYAVKFLEQVCHKKVIIYGVKGAFSEQLKQIASKAIELPATEELMKNVYPLVIKDMYYVSSRPNIVPSFMATARSIAGKNDLSEELVRAVLNQMISEGLLYTKNRRVDFNRSIPVLAPDWRKIEEEGLWSFE